MHSKPAVEKLPLHLKKYVIDQNYQQYTARNHAVWRYVMRRNIEYLNSFAHQSYMDGLLRCGISINKIPSIEDMNLILEHIGWGAVCVDGFIPPSAFMEFQAHQILVIAADIRSIEQIEYTPAPDIIHEAAGHAPIITNLEYAKYLQRFGKIGSKAFSSAHDYRVYEAIRHLSILKADPYSKQSDIEKAEQDITLLDVNTSPPSEMALIRNLHWWTVEYGLVGSLKNPKIYGAGLLSSIGESVWALSKQVEKIPYNLEAMDYSFDITQPQPQLFVTPSFRYLNEVLDEFAAGMSLFIGGLHGINKAIESENIATAVMRSGLQISGVFTSLISKGSNLVYIQTSGPTTLSYQNQVLPEHNQTYHANGYGTAVGKLKAALKPMRKLNEKDLEKLLIKLGEKCLLEFNSGLSVRGIYKSCTRKDDKLLIMSFADCLVKYQDQILFQPEWGTYDLAIGETITSVYSGVADAEAFPPPEFVPPEKSHKIQYTESEKSLFVLYERIRNLNTSTDETEDDVEKLIAKIIKDYPHEWLLLLEALEFIDHLSAKKKIIQHLQSEQFLENEKKLIDFGLQMIRNK
jgi:phenylalanine-4-hydroxylase